MEHSRAEAERNARAAKLARDLAAREQELGEQRRELKLLRAENGELKQRLRAAEDEVQSLAQRQVASEQATPVLTAEEAEKRIAFLEEQLLHLRSLVAQVQGERDFYNESYCNVQLELERCSAALLQTSNNETIANAHLTDTRTQLAAVSQSHQQDALALGQQRALAAELARELETYKQKELELVTVVASTQSQLQKNQKQSAELHTTMLLRDETIAGLRRELAQLDERLQAALKPRSRDYTQLLEEIEEHRKENAKLNAEKQRMQETVSLNKQMLADADIKIVELQRELMKERSTRQALAKKTMSPSDEVHIRKLLDEIHTLKLENAQLAMPQHHSGIAGAGPVDNLDAERMKAKRAEAALRALQKRVAYLLQVTEHSNKLAARWQEQKQLLKAQITGLSRANHELRAKLLDSESQDQRSTHGGFGPTFQTEVDVTDTSTAHRHEQGQEESMDNTSPDLLNGTWESHKSNNSPQSVAAALEQAIFDTNIALSRGGQSSQRVGGRGNAVPKVALATKPDGTLEVKVDANDITGHELMSKLQLKSFVRFCQTTTSSDPVKMCLEKMVFVINNTRAFEHQAIQKASRAKLECAKLAAQLTAWQLRLEGLKQFWNETKLTRHKTTVKYAKEVLANGCQSVTQPEGSDGLLHSGRSTPNALQPLTTTRTESSLELRLAGCMMDDETAYNVLRVIGGTLDDREANLAGLGPKLEHVMLDQPILLMNYGYVPSIVRLDLSNNYLTDMSAKLLAELVERATALCFLGLQQNCITRQGISLLKEGVRRNKTILYCSTFHNGFYLEGVRETALPERNTIATTLSEPRTRKPSLTIDIRLCDPDKELLLLSINSAVQESTELVAAQNAPLLAQTGRPPSSRKSIRSTSPLSRASPERRPASASMKRPRSALIQRPRHMSSKPGQLCSDDEGEGVGEPLARLPREKLGGILDERIRAMEERGIKRASTARPQSAPNVGGPSRRLLRHTAPPLSRQASPARSLSSTGQRLSPGSTRNRTPDRPSPNISNLTQRTINVYQGGRPGSATVGESPRNRLSHPGQRKLGTLTPPSKPSASTRGIRGIKGQKPVHGVLF